jgi:hypothetical protein
VIERFINIEWIINAIICQHYFRRLFLPFVLEVLYDEYFSFALKRRILQKIVENLDERKLQDLNRANTIRNYFAHCNQQIVEGPNLSAEGKVIDPRKIDQAIDFEKLHSEFVALAGGVEEYLMSIFKQKGGEFVKG